MLNILADSLLIALRMGAPRHSRDGRSPGLAGYGLR